MQRIDTNLLPIKEKAESFIRNSYHLKQMISELNIPGRLVQISYDTCNMYPSIPIDETLEITLRELEKDESLKERTNWKPYHIVKLCKILSKLWQILRGKYSTQPKSPLQTIILEML